MKFYQKEKGEFVQSYYMHEHGIICMAFSSDYKYIATTGKDSTLRVFEWENFEYSILTVHIYGPVQVGPLYTTGLYNSFCQNVRVTRAHMYIEH